MKRKTALIWLALLLMVNLSLAQFNSQTKTGITAATFLSIEVGARSKAMGSAFVALANDASALYWNPAGIATIKNNAVYFSHMNWLANVNFDYAAVSINMGALGTIGASVTSLTMPDMQVTTVFEPEGTGQLFSASDLAIGLSYARYLTTRFAIGFTGKFIQEKIFDMTANTAAFDFGTIFRTGFNDMNLGFSISNFGGDLRLSGFNTQVNHDIDPTEFGNNDRIFANLQTQSFQLPLIFRVGVSMEVYHDNLNSAIIAIDAVGPNDNKQYVNVGGEYTFNGILSLRAGYKTLFLTDSEEGVTLGAGLKYKLFGQSKFQFDYAYGDFGLLNNTQEFSLSIFF